METGNIDELLKWNAARRVAYNGSILHFMRSLYQKKLAEEKFEIQFIVKKDDKETAVPLKFFYGALNYAMDDSSKVVEISPREKEVAVIYKDEGSPDLYIQANPGASSKYQTSVLSFLPNESLEIERNGFYYEQNDITISGYWAWEKVGDMLPYDFKEKTVTTPGVVNKTKDPEITKPKTAEPAVTEVPVADTPPKTVVIEPIDTNEQKVNVAGGPLIGVTWQMQESRVIDGNNMFYYQRGAAGNTINFDDDQYVFSTGNTGIYFYNGQQYTFNWKFLDTEKTKMEMVILYPSALIVNFENIQVTATTLKYTRMQKVNGVNYVAIETRTVK
ncbi:MAG: hypothetical protein IPL84_15560 [Chitinophagaceae bacterium]|nr:hypothetical protein [Chitinophagaceae bacterium]